MPKINYPFLVSVAIAAILLILLTVPIASAAEDHAVNVAANTATPAATNAPATPVAAPAASPATAPAPAAQKGKPEGKPEDKSGEKPEGRLAANLPPPRPGDIYLRQVSLDEAAQLIARIGKTSIVVTGSVANKVVSLYLRDVSVDGMVKNLCRAAGVWYRFDAKTNTYLIMSATEYQQDIAITRDDVTRVYVLKHHNVVSIANAIQALFGDRVELIEPVEETAPTDLGGTSRSGNSSYGNSSSYNNSSYNNSSYNNNRASTSYGGVTRRSSGGRGGSQASDPRREMNQVSQTGLNAALAKLEALPEASDSAQAENRAAGGGQDSSRTENFTVSEVMRAVSRQGAPIHITYNLLHNLLLARTGDEAALKDIEALVREMDRPPRQVLLEMKIIEVELGNDFQSVFDIGFSGKGTSEGPMELLGANFASGRLADGTYPGNAASLGNFTQESATLAWQFVSDRLRARLQLMESENRVNTLATPMLVAANNQIARLFIGDERTLVTGASADTVAGTNATTSFITVETELRNVGQTLIILPRINADRSVTLTIDQDASSIQTGSTMLPVATPGGALQLYPIDTVSAANLQVTAHARDGLTVAVGGMISQTVSDGENKVPLLGDIPILGNLFKRTMKKNTRSQLVLLITPWVLETPEEGDALAREKESQTHELNDARRPHAGIFKEAPQKDYSSPLLDLLNPARKKP
jgi:general secretion pathway protein D